MSKISEYLNEHILGEITSAKAVRQRFSRDGSVLTIMPELVMFPRVTNDIRKAARFSWQLAEKGHKLVITARGGGSDQTGAAIGKSLIINTTAHLNNVIHLGLKDKERFVHLQPGVNFKDLNDILSWHGLYVPCVPESASYSTVGGAIANNSGGQLSGKYGLTGEWVSKLEVVLANGDLIETTKLNKHEFNKKKGLQTFEGEIYRKLDALIEDNDELIKNKLSDTTRDNAGYARLAQVKQKNGSFDLTPLMVGSQGTLGIISEVVMKTDFISPSRGVIVVSVRDNDVARDVADLLLKLDPASLETYDGELFRLANNRGKKYPFQTNDAEFGAVVYVMFNDFSNRSRAHKVKKATKQLKQYNAGIFNSDDYSFEELDSVREVMSSLFLSETEGESMPSLIDGSYIPDDRYGDFCNAVTELAVKHHTSLPIVRRVLDNTVFLRPTLHLSKVGDKQLIFKLTSEYAQLVNEFGGTFVAQSSEGRLKSNVAYASLDEDVVKLYEQVRAVFDPYGTLNPGVKQKNSPKELVDSLRSSFDTSDFSEYSPYN